MNYPQTIYEWMASLIFPVRCISCSVFSSQKKEYLCKKCLNLIPIKSDFECIGCRRKTVLGKTCPACQNSNSIDQFLSATDYSNPLVIKAVKTFKYRFIQEMAEPISSILKKYIKWLNLSKKFNILAENPVIIAVPLHPHRLNWRGFNQAELIAKSLSEILNCDFRDDVLIRIMMTKPQADTDSRDIRIKNMKKAFESKNISEIKGRTFVLVDDVCTTGATLNECARILKQNGARNVIGLVFAGG